MRWSAILILTALVACSASGDNPASADKQRTVRLIVGFQAGNGEPDGPALVDQLSRALGDQVVYLHDVSGNAAVYRLNTSLDASSLQARLDKLAGQAPVRYAELDRRRHIQTPPPPEAP